MDILTWSKPLPRGGNGSWMYPICIVLGFIVAIVASCMKMWKRYKVKVEPFYWFILIGVPVSIFGANFGSCVLGKPAGKDWSEFFTSFGTGLAVEWGVLFCFIAGLIYFPLILKKEKYRVRDEFGPVPAVERPSVWLYMDAILPCVLIAQAIGRWGNYCNQEVYGSVVTDQGLINFLEKFLPGMQIKGQWRQPLFFWESIANFAMFAILYVGIEFVRVRKTGDMAAAYFVWYGALRIGLEPLRDARFYSEKTMIFSIIYIVVGVLAIVCNHLFFCKVRKHKTTKQIFTNFTSLFNQEIYPRKLNRLNKKIEFLSKSDSIEDANKVKKLQDKVATIEAKWLPLKAEYDSPAWKEKYMRQPHELVYYGGW